MTIRGIIRTSLLVQLVLLLLLIGSFGWLSYDFLQVNASMTRLPHISLVGAEIERNAELKYRLVQSYIASNGSQHDTIPILQTIWQEDAGLKKRSSDRFFAVDKKISLRDIVIHLPVCKEGQKLLNHILNINDQLDHELKHCILLMGGFSRNSDGTFVRTEPPQPDAARQFFANAMPGTLLNEMSHQFQILRSHTDNSLAKSLVQTKSSIIMYMAVAGGAIFLLLCSLMGMMWVLAIRVERPLNQIGSYAEAIASGEEPQPLHLKFGDELASLYGSLLKMQSRLMQRIRELKASERSAQSSSQQAMLSKAQALSSLNTLQKTLGIQTDFLASVNEEIRKPVHDILSRSWLAFRSTSDKLQRTTLSHINKSGGALMDIFNRIQDSSGLEEGSMRKHMESFALLPFLEVIRQSVEVTAEDKGLSFTLELGDSLPSKIYGDRRHLEEVLRILLLNALKNTTRGDIGLSIHRASLDVPGKAALRFSVCDTGPEISDEAHVRLLSSPYTDDANTLSLGMGLPLARHLVHFMGGELTLSTSTHANNISFELVYDVTDENTATPARPLVLVVDDSDINLEIVCEILEQTGLETQRALDGKSALEAVQSRKPDLIIMDIQMPGMDGLSATRQLRASGYDAENLPVIAMTGQDDEASLEECMQAGMNAHLPKPLDVGALIEVLESWLPAGLPQATAVKEAAVPTTTSEPPSATSQSSFITGEFKCIDSGRGLAAVGGNTRLYQELLQRFVTSYGNSAVQLRKALEVQDMALASRLIHTVKGVAANLGLSRVTELAKHMEHLLPQTQPDSEDLDSFDAAMSETLSQIHQHWGQCSLSNDVHNRLLAEEHQQGLLRLLTDLPQRMERDWGSVESALEAFTPLVQGTDLAKEVNALLAAVNNFDIVEAEQKSSLLRRKLHGSMHENRLLH